MPRPVSPFKPTTQRHYLLLHGVGLLLLFLIFWTLNLWTDRRAVIRHEAIFNEQQSLQVQLAAQAMHSRMNEVFSALEIYTQYSFPELERGLRDVSSIQTLLDTTTVNIPTLLTLAYLDAPDSIVAQSGGKAAGGKATRLLLDWSEKYWSTFSDGRALPLVPPLHASRDIQAMGLFYPVLVDGKFRGILTGIVDLGTVIRTHIAPLRSGQHGAAFILGSTGQVLFDHEAQLIGRNVFDGLHASHPEVLEIDTRMLSEPSGTGSYSYILRQDGPPTRKLVAWRTAHFGDQSIIIALSAPDTEVNASMTAIRHERHIIGALLLLCLAGMSFLTYRKAVQPDIQASHRRLLDIVEFLPDPTFVIDHEGRVIAWNRAIAAMTGFKAKNMLGKGNFEYAVPFYGERRPGLIDLVGKDYTELIGRYHSVTRDGHAIYAETFVPNAYAGKGAHVWATASQLLDNNGNVVGGIESIRDITHRKVAEQQIRESEERYALAVQGANDGIWDWNLETSSIYLSPRCKQILGYSDEEFESIPGHWQSHVHHDDVEQINSAEEAVIEGREDSFAVEYRVRRRDGSYHWVLDRGTGVVDDDGQTTRILGAISDINTRKENETVSAIMLAMSSAVTTTRDLKTLYAAVHAILIEHIGAETFYIALVDTERDLIDFVYAKDQEHGIPWEPVAISSLKGKSLTLAVFNQAKPLIMNREQQLKFGVMGAPAEVWMGVPLIIKDKVIGVMAVNDYEDPNRYSEKDLRLLSSVSEQVALGIERNMNEEQLTHQALHDDLTSLPNRALFMERLGRAIRRSERRTDYRFAVVMMDLDRFKIINDSHGHLTGDEVLKETARRIAPVLRSVDTLARLGGDEFAILLEEFDKPQQVVHIVRRIQESVSASIMVGDHELRTTASVGIVIKTEDYASSEELLRDSDIAMYQAKQQGKGLFRVFNRTMHLAAMAAMALEHDLERALAAREFKLQYQPIFDAQTRALSGFEALIRWHHPERGPISPAEFIPVAEETGIIIPIGQWVLKQACATMAEWLTLPGSNEGLTISVNLSAKQASHTNLLAMVRRTLHQTNLPPHRLKLELTETAVMESPDASQMILERLKVLGVQLAIDDFGTGYSSLSHLSRLPMDSLKIDHSFIVDLLETEENKEIVKAIVVLAQALELEVVAEGVENEAQLEQVRQLGCNMVQGFHLGRPMDEVDARALLSQHS
ncbi:EAL domain-containing protein [Desulfovibrio ferrophilus]|uniref:Sensory box protein n=1 Tax=Desulfovibrio ferrophilus TaxID=241368 RepID=A0A2Z6B0Y4_9BACT|nr:EAL domain-containing protein [Desulfovibrio ferrophilus]BBD09134.1 sensory box protein [Desulfovibrio ferrophilus]